MANKFAFFSHNPNSRKGLNYLNYWLMTAYSDISNINNGSGPIASNADIEKAVAWAEAIIRTRTHPYVWGAPTTVNASGVYAADQGFDCSGMVWAAFYFAGFHGIGADRGSTANERAVFTANGFTYHSGNVTQSNLQRGDILWRTGHTGIWTGTGQAEFTGVNYGNSGINNLSSNWEGYLRYND